MDIAHQHATELTKHLVTVQPVIGWLQVYRCVHDSARILDSDIGQVLALAIISVCEKYREVL